MENIHKVYLAMHPDVDAIDGVVLDGNTTSVVTSVQIMKGDLIDLQDYGYSLDFCLVRVIEILHNKVKTVAMCIHVPVLEIF